MRCSRLSRPAPHPACAHRRAHPRYRVWPASLKWPRHRPAQADSALPGAAAAFSSASSRSSHRQLLCQLFLAAALLHGRRNPLHLTGQCALSGQLLKPASVLSSQRRPPPPAALSSPCLLSLFHVLFASSFESHSRIQSCATSTSFAEQPCAHRHAGFRPSLLDCQLHSLTCRLAAPTNSPCGNSSLGTPPFPAAGSPPR